MCGMNSRVNRYDPYLGHGIYAAALLDEDRYLFAPLI